MTYKVLHSLSKEQVALAIKEPNPVRNCEKENIFSVFCTKTGLFLNKLCAAQPVGTIECDEELTLVCITLHAI